MDPFDSLHEKLMDHYEREEKPLMDKLEQTFEHRDTGATITVHLLKIVIRDPKNSKVEQVLERYQGDPDIVRIIHDKTEKGYSVTITKL